MTDPQTSDDIGIPKFLQRKDAVKCLRCLIVVDADKIDEPDRCLDPKCALKNWTRAVKE